MKKSRKLSIWSIAILTMAPALYWGCGGDDDDAGVNNPDIAVCDPANGPFSTDITNPYFPVIVGSKSVLEGPEEGATIRIEVTPLGETQVIAGVTARVREEREYSDGVLFEVSRNFFVQATDGTVCYYGEDVDEYDPTGKVLGHSGSWRAGENGNKPGIQMAAHPAVGMSYDQEVAIGVAQDHGDVTSMGDSITVPFGTYTDTLTIEETSVVEPGTMSLKQYAKDVGVIGDETYKLISYTPAP